MQVQARAGAAVEEAPQQGEGHGKRTQIADHNGERGLLAHRKLRRVPAQGGQVMQKDARSRVEGSALVRERHAIFVAVEQPEAELRFQIPDRREDGRMRAIELGGRGLEAALGGDRVETDQLLNRQMLHCRRTLQYLSKLRNFLLLADRYPPGVTSLVTHHSVHHIAGDRPCARSSSSNTADRSNSTSSSARFPSPSRVTSSSP